MSINVSVFSCSQQFFFLLADEKNCMFATVFQRWGFETDWKIWLDETWFSHSLKDLLPLFSDPLLYFTQRNKTVGWHYQGKTELGKRFKGVWYFKAATASPNLLPPPKDMGCALVGNDKVPLVHGYQLLYTTGQHSYSKGKQQRPGAKRSLEDTCGGAHAHII